MKKTWLDDAMLVSDEIKSRKEANTSSLTEGRTYSGLYYAVPAEISESATTQILDSKGLRRLGYNVVADMMGTAIRQIVTPLRANLSPIGGDRLKARACDAMGLILDGALEVGKFTETARQVVADGMCFNTGGHVLTEIDPLTKNLRYERQLPDEVFFNYDRTQCVFRRFMTKRKARARFAGKNPELLDVIEKLDSAKPHHCVGADYYNMFAAEELVAVEYAFALAEGDEPARRVIKLGNTVVVDDHLKPEKLPRIPVDSMVWSRGHHGTWDGKALVRSIAGGHSWIQELVFKMHDSLAGAVPWKVGGDPKWENSDVPFQSVPNDPDTGEAAKVYFPPGVSADVRQAVTDLQAMVARATGISEAASEGAPPASITSGVGLANWKSIINEALSPQHQGYDNLHTDVSRTSVSLGPTAWNTPASRRKAESTRILEGIDFKELNLSEDEYTLSFDVTSDLGQHVPMKVELADLARRDGLITTPQYFQAIDIADWRAVTKRACGPGDLTDLQIAMALDRGIVMPPSEFQDPAMVAKESGNAWCAAMASAARPTRLGEQALRTLAQVAREMAMAQAGPAAAAPPAAPAPMPGAQPAAGALPPQPIAA